MFVSPGPFLLSTGLRVLQVTSLRLPLKSKVHYQGFLQNHHLHKPVFNSSKPHWKAQIVLSKQAVTWEWELAFSNGHVTPEQASPGLTLSHITIFYLHCCWCIE